MYHYKARVYSPTLGRFMQADPIGYGDGMNMYRYVGNDPVNAVDPSGTFGCYPGDTAPDTICVDGKKPRKSGSGFIIPVPVIKTVAKAIGKAAKSIFCGIFRCGKKKKI